MNGFACLGTSCPGCSTCDPLRPTVRLAQAAGLADVAFAGCDDTTPETDLYSATFEGRSLGLAVTFADLVRIEDENGVSATGATIALAVDAYRTATASVCIGGSPTREGLPCGDPRCVCAPVALCEYPGLPACDAPATADDGLCNAHHDARTEALARFERGGRDDA